MHRPTPTRHVLACSQDLPHRSPPSCKQERCSHRAKGRPSSSQVSAGGTAHARKDRERAQWRFSLHGRYSPVPPPRRLALHSAPAHTCAVFQDKSLALEHDTAGAVCADEGRKLGLEPLSVRSPGWNLCLCALRSRAGMANTGDDAGTSSRRRRGVKQEPAGA